ncbi:MAG: hypothetical protein ACR2PM_09580 [Hyphomicrobiales bacterium]
MGKFQKKPVVIDAVQWFPGKPVDGVDERRADGKPSQTVGVIKTLEGDMIARPGDWIVTGIEGEKYPVKDDIFKKTYERAD